MTEQSQQLGDTAGPELVPPYASEGFVRFLRDRNLAILDVRGGAVPDRRRLVLGPARSSEATQVVALVPSARPAAVVSNEEQVLRHAHDTLRTGLLRTIPRVEGRLQVYSSLDGLLLSAVPGLSVSRRRQTARRTRELLTAVASWMAGVWNDSATGTDPSGLGADDLPAVLTRHQPIPRLEPALDAIRRARLRLAEYEAPQTLTHGCLCPDHVFLTDQGLGVDDWEAGSAAGDPLRDAGRFAVHVAGPRLPEVLGGRSAFAGEVRQFMSAVLVHTPVPPRLWREVMVLAQLELATESLEHADPNGMHLLSRAVRLSGALIRTR